MLLIIMLEFGIKVNKTSEKSGKNFQENWFVKSLFIIGFFSSLVYMKSYFQAMNHKHRDSSDDQRKASE